MSKLELPLSECNLNIITLLLKFVSCHEVQVRSPVSRYLYRQNARKTY